MSVNDDQGKAEGTDDGARLLALQLSKDYEITAEAAIAMSGVGLEPTRSADLVGEEPDSARNAGQRSKKR